MPVVETSEAPVIAEGASQEIVAAGREGESSPVQAAARRGFFMGFLCTWIAVPEHQRAQDAGRVTASAVASWGDKPLKRNRRAKCTGARPRPAFAKD